MFSSNPAIHFQISTKKWASRALLMTLAVVFLLAMSGENAFADVVVDGPRAEQLMNVLEDVGSYVDCGAGTCGTYGDNIQCSEDRSRFPADKTECTLIGQSGTGGHSDLKATGLAAERLFDRLSQHVPVVCMGSSCGVNVRHMQCLSHNSAGQPVQPWFECTIQQN